MTRPGLIWRGTTGLGKALRRLLDPVVCPFCGHVQAHGTGHCAACRYGREAELR